MSSADQGIENASLTSSSSLTRHSYQRVQVFQAVTMTSLNVQVPTDDASDIITSTLSGPRCLEHQFNNLPANTPTSGQQSAKRTPSTSRTSSPIFRNLSVENYSPRTTSAPSPSANPLVRACDQFMIPTDPATMRRITSASRSLNQSINQTIKSSNCPSPLPPCSPSPSSYQSAIARARSFRSIIHDDPDTAASESLSPYIGSNRVLPQSPFHATCQSMNQSPTLGSPFGSSSFSYRSPSPVFPPSPIVRPLASRPSPLSKHFSDADIERILEERSTNQVKPIIYTPIAPESNLPDAPFIPRKKDSSSDQSIKRTTSTTASTPVSSPSSPPNVMSFNPSVTQSPDEDPEAYFEANYPWLSHKTSLIVSRKSDQGIKFISPLTMLQVLLKHQDFKSNNQSNNQLINQKLNRSSQPLVYSDFGYHYDKLIILDCRFAFEYRGGHLPGAYHVDTFDQVKQVLWPQGMHSIDQSTSLDANPLLPWSPRTLIILHCEFSQSRAPAYYKALKRLELDVYGAHTFPEMFVMQGGYREFQDLYLGRFNPPLEYTAMIEEKHRPELRLAMKRRRNEKCGIERDRTERVHGRGMKRSMSCLADVDESVSNQTNNRSTNQSNSRPNTRSNASSEPALNRTKSSLL